MKTLAEQMSSDYLIYSGEVIVQLGCAHVGGTNSLEGEAPSLSGYLDPVERAFMFAIENYDNLLRKLAD